jgi:hypothetical protein
LLLANGVQGLREHQQLSTILLDFSRAALGLLPAGLYMGFWFMHGVKESGEHTDLLKDLLVSTHSLADSAQLFYNWSLGSLKGWPCDVPILVLMANLVLVGVWAASWLRVRDEATPREYYWPLILLLVTTRVFLLLPMMINSPLTWWAVSVRLVVPIWLFLILALPRARTRLPFWLFLPALAVSMFQGVVLTRDFVRFDRQDMAHFDQAIAAIPPGVRLLALWTPTPELDRYRDVPMNLVANYYIARNGGVAHPSLTGNTRHCWVQEKIARPWSDSGDLKNFRWKDHGIHYDYFLIRDPVEGLVDRPGALNDARAGELSLAGRFGTWRLWRRGDGGN